MFSFFVQQHGSDRLHQRRRGMAFGLPYCAYSEVVANKYTVVTAQPIFASAGVFVTRPVISQGETLRAFSRTKALSTWSPFQRRLLPDASAMNMQAPGAEFCSTLIASVPHGLAPWAFGSIWRVNPGYVRAITGCNHLDVTKFFTSVK